MTQLEPQPRVLELMLSSTHPSFPNTKKPGMVRSTRWSIVMTTTATATVVTMTPSLWSSDPGRLGCFPVPHLWEPQTSATFTGLIINTFLMQRQESKTNIRKDEVVKKIREHSRYREQLPNGSGKFHQHFTFPITPQHLRQQVHSLK